MNNRRHQPNTSAAHALLSPSTILDDEIEEHASSCCLSDMEKAMLGEDIVPCGGCLGESNITCFRTRPGAARVLYREGNFCTGRPAERELTAFILSKHFGFVFDSDPLPDRCLDDCPRANAPSPNEFVEKLALRALSCQEKSDEEYCLDLVRENEEIESLRGTVVTFPITNIISVYNITSSLSGVSVNANEIEEIVNQWGFGGFGIKLRGECVIAHAECEGQKSHIAADLLGLTMSEIVLNLSGICQSCIASWLGSSIRIHGSCTCDQQVRWIGIKES